MKSYITKAIAGHILMNHHERLIEDILKPYLKGDLEKLNDVDFLVFDITDSQRSLVNIFRILCGEALVSDFRKTLINLDRADYDAFIDTLTYLRG